MALESLCNRPPQISRSLIFDQDIKFPDFELGNMTIKISDDTHSTDLEPSASVLHPLLSFSFAAMCLLHNDVVADRIN